MLSCRSRALSYRDSHLKEFRFSSMERVCFYAKGLFLRRRHVSTAEVYFYGEGILPRRRLISTAEAYFYGGGVFL